MRPTAKLDELHATTTHVTHVTHATGATGDWVESGERLLAGWLELNTQLWTGWFTLQQTCWQQAQKMVDELPLWMNWQYGTEQLA